MPVKDAGVTDGQPETDEIVGVKFRTGGKIYYFSPQEYKLVPGDQVIVETARGIEFGTVSLANRVVRRSDIVSPLKKVIRLANNVDLKKVSENTAVEERAKTKFIELVAGHGLDMALIDVEYTFDNTKLLFYFTADGRIDFRELVKDLASVFKTRIELRQIGVRDEAKQIGGLGICGRPFCCKTFLDDFSQVSIKMAKDQNLSLNSVKISGTCGRLMCCLRFENQVYEEEARKTPRVDSIVMTPKGGGTVIEANVLSGFVKVKLDSAPDLAPEIFNRDDLKVTGMRKRIENEKRDELSNIE
ncbi:MAG: stage 0 sporulation family protein [Oscillospiraceae bacterium]|nr:stage 0 sporulation family protein [Oscillospiraceae bacterium]